MADPIAELNPLDDLGQAVLSIELAPIFLRRDHQLEGHGQTPVSRLRHPLVRFVRCLTVANVLSIGFGARMCFQCSAG